MLAALGEVALRHAHLDHMLKMTIKSLLGITIDAALVDTRQNPSWKLRKRIEDEARSRLGTGDDFDRLSELLERCRGLSEQRNRFLKDIWAVHLSEPHVGTQAQLGNDLLWRPTPSVEEVRELAASIESMVDEITDARLHGWLGAAYKCTYSRKHAPATQTTHSLHGTHDPPTLCP
jgi:hypothetical protein